MRRLVLAVLLLLAPSSALAEWWEARTDHFIVYSQSSARDAKAFAEKLERFDQAVRSLQLIKPDDKLSDSRKVTIFRTGDRGDIAVLAGSPNSGIAGFYIPRASGSVAFVPAKKPIGEKAEADDLDAQTILFHEYAHHLMFRHFPAAYPSWYVEGFAEAYSTLDLRDDGTFHLGNPPQARARALFGGLNYSIERMLLSSDRPTFEDYYGRYTYGWLLTHYLTFEPSRQGQLQTYLKLINGGTPSAEAARKAFGDLRQLEKEVQRYKNRRLPGAHVKPGNYSPPAVAMRKLGEDEEAIIRVRMRSAVGVNESRARDVAADARAIAAKFPRSLPVLLALVEAEFDAKRLEDADRAADAALALDPANVKALLYKGLIAMERGKADRNHFANARSWLAKAHKADPGNAVPLFMNYMTYVKAGQAAPENAIIGLERAYMLAPYDDEVRMVLASQLLAEGKGSSSRALLTPVALSPHESKRAKALSEVVELIDDGKLTEASTALRARLTEEEQERSGKKPR